MNGRALLFLAAMACAAVAVAAFPPGAAAQYQVKNGTFASAGGVAGNGHNIVYSTAGEPIIGIAAGASNSVKAGFWYTAGISSTVDVAITSFFGELKEDAVLLSWTVSASTPVDGYNVYRAQGAAGTFARLNDALIPRDRGGSYKDETALAGAAYVYRIGAVSGDKEWYSQSVSLALPPKPVTLYQNYPNPFNPSTSIVFYLPLAQHATLVIYDVKGSRVRTLVDEAQPVGRHAVRWDGKNDNGVQVGSGVYYYRLKAGKDIITKKLVVVR
ncbi:MAG TPA: FlgD immunoglobulin-like domain containing protein [Candidatus Bathyarchaeia archaeon]|nr:FlgD immunoglobulin-like domain containing protein [Candidatus Bathyarchaeia archaeon]